MSEISSERRTKSFKLCQEFLGGPWKELSIEDFHIEHISGGGLSNMLYMCAIKPEKRPAEPSPDDPPHTVMIRIYGKIIQENPETVVTDSVIFALLSEQKMGPKLYGVFTEGRVEQYIPSRHLYTSELADPAISQECARKMAKFHKLTMPLVKKPVWLFNCIDRYLEDALQYLALGAFKAATQRQINVLNEYNLEKELDNLKSILSGVDSPVVFCHNDLQEGNILILGAGKDLSLMPIDFEYASYNYRGFDFGNHFCEFCYNYSVSEVPYYSANINAYPTREQQLLFFRAYLEESGISGDQTELEENMLLEASAYALASHFFWGLWSIVQANISDIKFDYMEYALVRFKHYFQQKASLPAKIQINGIS